MGGGKQKKKHTGQSNGNPAKARQTANATESSQTNGVDTKPKVVAPPAVPQPDAAEQQHREELAALQSKVEAVSEELRRAKSENINLKLELYCEKQAGLDLREQLTRSQNLSYFAFAVATAATAAFLAAKLQRPH